MKKLLLFASLALVFASCEKEKLSVSNNSSSIGNQTLAGLIQQGDLYAYNQFYNLSNQRGPKPSIKFIHGIFVYNPNQGPENGTCLPHPTCPCLTIITWPAFVEPTTPEEQLISNYQAAFSEAGQGELIINDNGNAHTINNVKSINVVFDRQIQGKSTFSYTLL